MIESVGFQNLKVLRDAVLPLSRVTVLVGPNGSGKSTALLGLEAAAGRAPIDVPRAFSVGVPGPKEVRVRVRFGGEFSGITSTTIFAENGSARSEYEKDGQGFISGGPQVAVEKYLARVRRYSLSPAAIARRVQLAPAAELASDGGDLCAVLDRLRDQHPERFEQLNREFASSLQEFDRILFDTPEPGRRSFSLRLRDSRSMVASTELSEGTLMALALLTLAYLPEPPSVVALEEPDRGIHPRLLRHVKDALYRLAYPESVGEERAPVQVIATTHSPYFLDLFKEHPEEVVVAERLNGEARFQRITDRMDLEQILQGAPLGEVWYSGILGGVPIGT